jgi:DNA repair protein RadC
VIGFFHFYPKEKNMDKEHLTKIDIVKIQMVKDGTLDYGKKAIRGPQDLAELGHKFIKNADREIFLLVSLNSRNHINCIHVVSIGTINTALVAPREVMKIAILSSAAGIACIHNHPSGDPDPSNDDIQITNRIAECAKLFGIGLIDHVIISDDGKYESFMEKGLISKTLDSPIPTIREEEKTLSEDCRNRYEANLIGQTEEQNFGQQYCQVTGYRKNLVKGGNFPHKLVQFKEFTELMRTLASQGIAKHTKAHKKDPGNVIPNTTGDERHIHFALEDLIKKIIRFRFQRSDKDLVKLALWSYLLWMKLYPNKA